MQLLCGRLRAQCLEKLYKENPRTLMAATKVFIFTLAVLLASCSAAPSANTKNNALTTRLSLTGSLPGSLRTQCVQIPEKSVEFGDVSTADINRWFGLDKLLFANNTQHLASSLSDAGEPYIRQRLIPTLEGSTLVSARGELAPAASYRLTQSFYLEPGFDWGDKNEGGKLGFGLGGNTAPTGGMTDDSGFSARIMWRGQGNGSARFSFYIYSSDRSQNLPFGDDYIIDDYAIPIGEWVDVAMEVTANSDVSASDGSFRVWINDQLKLDQRNLQWQAKGSKPVVNRLLYTTFHGGGDSTWSPATTVFVRTSSICWQSGSTLKNAGLNW